jgi:malic enzyme
LCLDTQDVDEIIAVVKAVAPGFAGINLEDISAPRCFEIERRLREQLDIPVFHDDQHGTAIVVLAALLNALRVVGKQISDVKIVISGAGAAGTAIIKLLLAAGAGDVVVADIAGVARGTAAVARRAHQPAELHRDVEGGGRRRGRVHRRLGPRGDRRHRCRSHGRRRDRIRAGQS